MARRRDFLVDKKIGSVIRMQRVKLGISQAELGNALGVTFQQIQKYEHGTNAVASTCREWYAVPMQAAETAVAGCPAWNESFRTLDLPAVCSGKPRR
jgi:transcriptional regulator with XRE-family HTH domain